MSRYQTPELTADGRSGTQSLNNTPRGGGASLKKTVAVIGDFGGGTATLQQSLDNGVTWFDVLDTETPVRGAIIFEENKSLKVEIASDALNPTLLSINLVNSTNPSLIFYIHDAT